MLRRLLSCLLVLVTVFAFSSAEASIQMIAVDVECDDHFY